MDLSAIESWTKDMLEAEARRRGIREPELRSRGELVRLILRDQYGDRLAQGRQQLNRGLRALRTARELMSVAVGAAASSLPEPFDTLVKMRAGMAPTEGHADDHPPFEEPRTWEEREREARGENEGTGSESEPVTDSGSVAESVAVTDSGSVAESVAVAESESESESVAESVTDSGAVAESVAVAESGSESESESGSEPEPAAPNPWAADDSGLHSSRPSPYSQRPPAPELPAPPAMPEAPSSVRPSGPPSTRSFVEEPIRTHSMARLLASQGHRERALAIYEELLARDSGDGSLSAEAEALREGTLPEAPVLPERPAHRELPRFVSNDRVELTGEAGSLAMRWEVTDDGFRRARAVLGRDGELAVRVVTIGPDPERVVSSRITEHGPVEAQGEWTTEASTEGARCFAAIGLREGDRFVSIAHAST